MGKLEDLIIGNIRQDPVKIYSGKRTSSKGISLPKTKTLTSNKNELLSLEKTVRALEHRVEQLERIIQKLLNEDFDDNNSK